jgi:hypothetical protein
MPPGQISAGDEPLTNQKRGGLDLGVLGLVSSNFHQLNFTCVKRETKSFKGCARQKISSLLSMLDSSALSLHSRSHNALCPNTGCKCIT